MLDHNVYYSSTGTEAGTWQWKEQHLSVLRSYQDATGNDGASMFENPVFVEPGTRGDFRLERTSPAIDAGAYLPQAGAVDLGEETRLADRLPTSEPTSCRRRPRLRRPCYRSR